MLEVFDKSLKKMAILHNAIGITETKNINTIYRMEFQLPDDDPKNEFCQPFHHVRHDDGELYRIMPYETESTETGTIRYECEHVIATLIDDVMFGFHQVGNIGYFTNMAINYVLSWQTTRKWVLDRCDMNRQFEYGWEQENLLGALFGIPKPSVQSYMWTYNTHVSPFRLSLVELNENALPSKYIRKGHNRLTLTRQSDPRQLCTRLYALGAGEGVNQLGISSVNAGKPYIQSPQSYIDKYGLITRIWIDRRYTDEQSLLESARAMLDELQTPIVEYSVSANEPCELGSVVRIVETGTNHIVTGITVKHEDVPTYELRIANRPRDIAETVADLADRQRIETAYAQGATQIWSDSVQTNADQNDSAVVSLYIPKQMLILNSVNIKIKMGRYRGEVQTTNTSGSSQTESGGGGSVNTEGSLGGQQSVTLEPSSMNSSSRPAIETGGPNTKTSVNIDAGGSFHTHSITWGQSDMAIPYHSHSISHTHQFQVPSHRHPIVLPDHRHTFDTTHNHNIEPAFNYWGNASGFWVLVNGTRVKWVSGQNYEGDIAALLTNAEGIVPRGSWITVECLPDDRARFDINYTAQGFIQSRGGGQY